MPAPTLRLLTSGQRVLLRVVLGGCAVMVGNSAYLLLAAHVAGVGEQPGHLPVTYQAMLLLHLGLGATLFIPAMVFAIWHLRRVLRRRSSGALPTGIGLFGLAVFLLLSGLFILTEANSRANLWAFVGHQAAAALLPAVYVWHRLVSVDRLQKRSVIRGLLLMGVVLGLVWVVHGLEVLDTSPPSEAEQSSGSADRSPTRLSDPFVPFVAAGDASPASPFFPGNTTSTSGKRVPARVIHGDALPDPTAFAVETGSRGFAAEVDVGASTCGRCHPDVVEQWRSSAHRFASFNNPFYRKAVELTRETRGRQVSQWCGGCHDPAIMLPGTMLGEIDPLTPEAQAGLTCLACHAIDRIHNQTGNGNYNVPDQLRSPYLFASAPSGLRRWLHDYLLKARPTVHRRQMLKPFFQTSEFCATCHKVNLDVPVNGYRWVRGQNEYDAWHNSGFAGNNPQTWYQPPARQGCRECHMPLEAAPLGDVAAKQGKVRSHRFLAVNTALPYLRGDQPTIERIEHFLQDGKLRVDVFAVHREEGDPILAADRKRVEVRPGEWVQVDVVVRNLGVGHTFPGGTNDSNEGWLDFQVRQGNREIWRSGAIGPDQQVDPAAHFYQAVLVDKRGQRISRRNPADIHATVYANVIAPSTSDIARYLFRIPPDAAEGMVEVTAELKWRKFNRTFTEFVFEGKEVPELPVTRIAQGGAQLLVSPIPKPRPDPPRAEDWVRYNDYGIGLMLDGQTRRALEAFRVVAGLVPERGDGWRNQARAYLRDGNLAKAEEALRRASEAAPEDPQNAFFWGQLLQESGRLELAVQAYRRTLQAFPQSRDAWSLLGRTHWQRGDYRESIAAYLEVLRIDPEDALAHHQRSLAYRALAASETDPQEAAQWARAASEAEKAFEKYKLDEDAAAVTLDYRLRHPLENLMSQQVVVHRQEEP